MLRSSRHRCSTRTGDLRCVYASRSIYTRRSGIAQRPEQVATRKHALSLSNSTLHLLQQTEDTGIRKPSDLTLLSSQLGLPYVWLWTRLAKG